MRKTETISKKVKKERRSELIKAGFAKNRWD